MNKAMSLGPIDMSLAPLRAERGTETIEPAVIPPRPLADVLASVRELGDAAAAIDPRKVEDDELQLAALSRDLQLLLARAVDALSELRRIDDAQREPEPIVFDEDIEESSITRLSVLSPPRLANVCFAGSFELGRVLRELAIARTMADVLVAAETARRKLLRAFRAVLDAADDVVATEPSWRHEATDLRTALVVRKLYSRFRRALRRATDEDAEAVLTAVRYAGGALAALVTAPAYAEVRSSDRALLRRLHERALAWARHDREVVTGLQLLDDVWTTADLLRNINRRQELRAHDAIATRVVLRGPEDGVDTWLAQLLTLVGIDDELDAEIERITREPHPEAHAAELSARVRQLR